MSGVHTWQPTFMLQTFRHKSPETMMTQQCSEQPGRQPCKGDASPPLVWVMVLEKVEGAIASRDHEQLAILRRMGSTPQGGPLSHGACNARKPLQQNDTQSVDPIASSPCLFDDCTARLSQDLRPAWASAPAGSCTRSNRAINCPTLARVKRCTDARHGRTESCMDFMSPEIDSSSWQHTETAYLQRKPHDSRSQECRSACAC